MQLLTQGKRKFAGLIFGVLLAFLNFNIMAIIRTPKGWAIEFDVTNSAGYGDFNDLQNEYYSFTNGLIDTIQTAANNKDMSDPQIYYTLELLRAMLPSFEQMKDFKQHIKMV